MRPALVQAFLDNLPTYRRESHQFPMTGYSQVIRARSPVLGSLPSLNRRGSPSMAGHLFNNLRKEG